MSTTKQESTGIYWIGFLISLVAFVLMLMYCDSFFWVTLPGLLTCLIKGLRWM